MKFEDAEKYLNFCKQQTTNVKNYLISLKDTIKTVVVKDEERGLLFKDGLFKRVLKSGKYYFPPMINYEVKLVNINNMFTVPGYNIDLFLKDETLLKELTIIEVKDYEIALHYENGVLKGLYKAGKYAFFNVIKKHEFKMIDKRIPYVEEDIDKSIFINPLAYGHFFTFDVFNYEAGLLYYNNVFQKVLTEGKYYFWYGVVNPLVTKVDLRQQQLEITGQELMTADKITIRLNFVSQYKIVDPVKIMQTINNYSQQIYTLLQLVLREYIGSFNLDDILKKKQEIGDYVLTKMKEKGDLFGIEFIFCGVKDIILPGEIKDILNTVLIAEKKAQANVITRREETASTRSLLNTAKLLEENETLYKLKEMEYIEKICEKITSISLTGSNNIVDQISGLLLPKKEK